MTPLQQKKEKEDNNVFSTTRNMFQKYSTKKACVKLAYYIQTKMPAVKGKKIYVTQVPKEQLLQFTDRNLVKAKPMLACDYWSQDLLSQNNKKEALKLEDLIHELTNKTTGSILTKENGMNKSEFVRYAIYHPGYRAPLLDATNDRQGKCARRNDGMFCRIQ